MAEWTEEMATALDAALDRQCREAGVIGMALAVFRHGQPVFEKFWGFRNAETKQPVDRDTVFGTASITKSLTALAVMQLDAAGTLTVKDTLAKWLPELRLPDSAEKEIAVHHLLSHTSGFPGMAAVNAARAASIRIDPDGKRLFESLIPLTDYPEVADTAGLMELISKTDFRLLGPPGAVFNYSNEGYALLQEIIERASGKPYITYVTEHILKPLGMTRSVFRTEELSALEDVTELYAFLPDSKEAVHSPVWWDVGRIYSNGSLKCSLNDLMKMAEAFRTGSILSEESVRKMASPHAALPVGGQYGYGLQLSDLKGVRLFGHGGSIKGVSSHMKVVPDEGLTAGVLVNVAGVDAEKLVLTAIRHVLGMPEDKGAGSKPEVKHNEDTLKTFEGLYQSDEGQQAEIRCDTGRLFLKAGKENLPLEPYERGGFQSPDGGKIKFLTNDEGKVTGLFKGVRVIPKVTDE